MGVLKIIAGVGAIVGGVLSGNPMLAVMGAGMVLNGIGSIISGNPIKGFATTERNPIAPWKVLYGQCRVGGTMVYYKTWGGNNQMLDLVIVLAAHPCLSVDSVLIDQQRIAIDVTTGTCSTSGTAVTWVSANGSYNFSRFVNGGWIQINGVNYLIASVNSGTSITLFTSAGTQTNAGYMGGGTAPGGALPGSGTSFTPQQTTINMTSIVRANNVVTIVLPSDIPYLQAGDQIQVQDIGSQYEEYQLEGIFEVQQIISRVPSGGTNILTFTILNGGLPVNLSGNGQVQTHWAQYGRNIYFEWLNGTQTLGQTFAGMTNGTPWYGGTTITDGVAIPGGYVQPDAPGLAGDTPGGDFANPWTSECSLMNKTAVFLRLTYEQDKFSSGLPQFSFLVHGNNQIYDPRNGGTPGVGSIVTFELSGGTGYVGRDVVTVVQSGASGGQIVMTTPTIGILAAAGQGYSVATGLSVTGGSGSGMTVNILSVNSGGYSNNSALCTADFLTNQLYGFKASYGTDVPTSPLIAAANICDTAVTLAAGGTEPMYACDGQFTLEMSRGEILQNMLSSCAGRLTYVGGQYVIWPGTWPTGPAWNSTTTYNPGDQVTEGGTVYCAMVQNTNVTPPSSGTWTGIPVAVNLTSIAAGPFKWRPTCSIRDLYNGVKGTYISPANKWQSSDFPYYAQDSMHGYSGPSQYGGDINLAADGGDRRWLEMHLPFTTSPSMAQRIAKIELLRRRHYGTGTFALNMAGYQFATLDIIQATVPYLGWSGKELEISAVRFRVDEKSGALGTEIDVQETDSSIYAWSVTEELSAQGYQQVTIGPTTIVEPAPYPWSPGYVSPLAGDALGGPASFGMQPSYTTDNAGNPVTSLMIKGQCPFNQLDTDIGAPYVTATVTTGGSIPAGTYVIGVSAFDAGSSPYENTPYLDLAVVTVPANGQITVNVEWGSGDDGGDVYMALWESEEEYTFHYQATLTSSQTSATISSFNISTPGGPDPEFYRLAITWQADIHGGNWAEQVQAVTSNTITFAQPASATAMTTNQWAGYTLSLLAKYDPTVEVPILNLPIQSSTASTTSGSYQTFTVTIGPNAGGTQIANLTTLLAVGDLLVCRFHLTFTANSFTDPNIANPYYPTGMTGTGPTGPEAGHLAVVLTGVDAGDMQTISGTSQDSNGNYTIVNLAGAWATTPNTGDIVIIVAPPLQPAGELTVPLTIPNKTVGSVIVAQPSWINLPGQAYLVTVRTEDEAGNHGSDTYAPAREIYFFGQQGTRVVTN